MRKLSNSVLAALIVAALFWGNCFSCPQLLLSLAQNAAHSCCKRSAPVTKTCTTNVLKQFVKADRVAVQVPAAAPDRVAVFVPVQAAHDLTVVAALTQSPPELLALTSTLRI